MNKLLSRKFLITVLVLLIASVGLFINTMSAPDWIELAKWLVATYLGSNVVEKGVVKYNKSDDAP